MQKQVLIDLDKMMDLVVLFAILDDDADPYDPDRVPRLRKYFQGKLDRIVAHNNYTVELQKRRQ